LFLKNEKFSKEIGINRASRHSIPLTRYITPAGYNRITTMYINPIPHSMYKLVDELANRVWARKCAKVLADRAINTDGELDSKELEGNIYNVRTATTQ
jgi:hypothetical protein